MWRKMITEWIDLGYDHSKTNDNMYIVYMDQFLTELFKSKIQVFWLGMFM